MLLTALVIFILTSMLGLYLITYIFQHKETPKGIVFIHGPLGAIGIVLLVIYSLMYSPVPYISLTAFVIAAIGGFVMIFRDILQKSVPISLASIHGIVAIIGLTALIIFIFS